MGPLSPLRIAWLVPDDMGGGVISVAQSACRQAAKSGHRATLLLMRPSTGSATEFGGVEIATLGAEPPYADVPARIMHWLRENPQDLIVFNACEQADVVIPYVPACTRVIYVVHDTPGRFFSPAIKMEVSIDAFVAVSHNVAEVVRPKLRDQRKLSVVHNGTLFADLDVNGHREEALMFLGGDKTVKGAYDVLQVWTVLERAGFGGSLHWFGPIGEEFQTTIKEMGGSERIHIHQRQARARIFDCASRSKVVLMLSRVEPFGMSTIECMGMGCLAVAWDIKTGTKEIAGSDGGIFAKLGNYEELSKAVFRALGNHSSIAAKATQRIRSEFSEQAMWTGYDALLNQIFAKPVACRRRVGREPPHYKPPIRVYQLLPSEWRSHIRRFVGRSPALGYLLRNSRGW